MLEVKKEANKIDKNPKKMTSNFFLLNFYLD
jgi:hypothetical protein